MKSIHISDVRQFLSCRRAWDFSSLLRQGWEPDPMPIHFLVGRLVHFALYAYYEEGVHPAFAYQQMLDRHIKENEPELAIPNETSRRQQQINMGREIVSNYYKWVVGNDAPDEDWTTISNETKFHLPLFNAEGHKSTKIELAGRFDRLARKSDGSIWLWEFKTTAREPDPEWLLLDNQVTTYLHAAEQIIGEPIAGVHFRFLKKKFPEKPHRIHQGRDLSRAINSGAQGVSTTYDLYLEALEELVIEQMTPKYAPNPIPEVMLLRRMSMIKEEYRDVLDALATRGWEEYFITKDVAKTPTEVFNATRDLWTLGLEMVRPTTKIYPTPEWMKCRFCSYREPCLMLNRGQDPSKLLKFTYKHRNIEEGDLDTILSGGEE